MISEQTFFLIVSIPSIILGIFLYVCPRKTIDIQIKFYSLINWRVEPISMEKEIRNTKWMGAIVIIFFLGLGFYLFVLK